MERFDAAIEHFRKSREVRDLTDRDAMRRQVLRRAAGGKNLRAKRGKALCKVHDTCLVVDTDESALNFSHASS
jgi:hypothetical protein